MGSTATLPNTMQGMVYLGDKKVEIKSFPVPEPRKGEVLLKMKASSICGSDLHAIYRLPASKWMKNQEGYFDDIIGGHEPAGQVVALGEGTDSKYAIGDRCLVFHVGGCYQCQDCSETRYCSCTTPMELGKPNAKGQWEGGKGRRAYGWQRNGGHGEYILCDVETLIKLPDALTYLDGAMIACGYGTAYSAVMKIKPEAGSKCFVIGLGPVGLAVAQVCQKLGAKVYGYELVPGRREFAKTLGIEIIEKEEDVPIAEDGVAPRDVGFDYTFDVTGAAPARVLAVRSVKRWGTTMMIGGYGDVTLQVSPWVIQKQLTIRGSWTFSANEGRQLCEDLVKWNLHPDILISHKFPVSEAAKAYEVFDKGLANKVAIVEE